MKDGLLGRQAAHVRHLLRELAVYADWRTGECFPSQELLGERLHLTRPTVSLLLTAADESGWLEKLTSPAPERSGRGWRRNRYRLRIPPAAEAALAERCRESERAGAEAGQGRSRAAGEGRSKTRPPHRRGRRENSGGGRLTPGGGSLNGPTSSGNQTRTHQLNPSANSSKNTARVTHGEKGPNPKPYSEDWPELSGEERAELLRDIEESRRSRGGST